MAANGTSDNALRSELEEIQFRTNQVADEVSELELDMQTGRSGEVRSSCWSLIPGTVTIM